MFQENFAYILLHSLHKRKIKSAKIKSAKMREKVNERVCGEKRNVVSKARLNGANKRQTKIESESERASEKQAINNEAYESNK